jgi:hypothetical protein
MPVVFNDGKDNQNKVDPVKQLNAQNEVIKKIVNALQKLEEEFVNSRRTTNSKINGNNFSLTEKLRTIETEVESIDTRVSVIGERTPEEMMIEPVRDMVSQGYVSIQIQASADVLEKASELKEFDRQLSQRLDEEVSVRESVVLSLATDITSMDERSQQRTLDVNSRLGGGNSGGNVYELQATIQNLKMEVNQLKGVNNDLKIMFENEKNRVNQMVESLSNRIM